MNVFLYTIKIIFATDRFRIAYIIYIYWMRAECVRDAVYKFESQRWLVLKGNFCLRRAFSKFEIITQSSFPIELRFIILVWFSSILEIYILLMKN